MSGHGGIGRRVGFRCQWATVWVRVPLAAVMDFIEETGEMPINNRFVGISFLWYIIIFCVRTGKNALYSDAGVREYRIVDITELLK